MIATHISSLLPYYQRPVFLPPLRRTEMAVFLIRLNVCTLAIVMLDTALTQNGITTIFWKDVKDVYVTVRDNNVDQALRVLKKKMQREGVFREMKNRRSYEKPSERRAREAAESTRRVRKLMRKRLEREGY